MIEHSETLFVAAPPDELYDMVSDVTRMGEWSPVCVACWWDEGCGPWPGASFTGRNVTPTRTWETRSRVVTADRGMEFAFVVGEDWVRWAYLFREVPQGTSLTESWAFLPAGLAHFELRYGQDAHAEIAERTGAARAGIPLTLDAIKRAAERAGTLRRRT